MPPFRKLLVANRGEIAIRVFRSAHELGIRTVAVYSHEDRFGMHRLKADEAYPVGKPGEPIRSYLDVRGIVELAREKEVEAIHPGYGFLSENAAFARACEEAGIAWVGPRPELLELLGVAPRATHRPAELSGGEQQRVAIARAAANRPRVILADEPTGNLDPATSELVFAALQSLIRDEGAAGLIATHNHDLARRADRIVTLKDGLVQPLTL